MMTKAKKREDDQEAVGIEAEKTCAWRDHEMWRLGPYCIVTVNEGRLCALPGGYVVTHDVVRQIAMRNGWELRRPLVDRKRYMPEAK